jgi:hypothetical protein
MGFPRGRVVLRRHFQRGRQPSRVWVGHVAADDKRGLWLWVATGGASLEVRAADGRAQREMPFAEWGRVPKVVRPVPWRGDVLLLHPPDAAYSVWFFFAPVGTFANWYVNLENPIVRWDDGALAGVDTIDHDLDIVVAPDRTWWWKDEDEFAEYLRYPEFYWVSDADAVWGTGKRVVALVEAGEFPFDGTGCDFRPPPQWPVPTEVPAGWDRPCLW